jgi:hypothetical protein
MNPEKTLMNEKPKTSKRQKIFQSKETKKLFQKGLKFLALSLPLLFAAPVIVTMGFKALNKGSGSALVIVGCVLTVFTIALMIQAFRLILKSLFSR